MNLHALKCVAGTMFKLKHGLYCMSIFRYYYRWYIVNIATHFVTPFSGTHSVNIWSTLHAHTGIPNKDIQSNGYTQCQSLAWLWSTVAKH